MFERFIHVKVQINDPEFFRTVPVSAVVAYLSSNGWSVFEEVKVNGTLKGSIYSKNENYVMVPAKEGVSDYALQMRDLFRKISREAGINELVLTERILVP